MNMMMLARSKQSMISETGEHQRDKNKKLLHEAGAHLYSLPTTTQTINPLYEAGLHPYSLPTTTQPIKKLEVFTTKVDTMSTTNGDEE